MTIDVASFITHENFSWDLYDNDIAVIELAEEVDLSIYTPACLAKTSDTTTFDGKNASVYGNLTYVWSDDNDVWPRLGGNIIWRIFI